MPVVKERARIYYMIVCACVLLLAANAAVLGASPANGAGQNCPEQTNGNVIIPVVTSPIDNNNNNNLTQTIKLPCNLTTPQWYLRVMFETFPFDCSRNESYVQHSQPRPGSESIRFCKVGTGDPGNTTIVDENNEARIGLIDDARNQTIQFDLTLTYVPNGHPSPNITEIFVHYQFVHCLDGLSNTTSCKAKTTVPTTSTSSSTTSTSTTTTSTTTTTTTSKPTTSTVTTTPPPSTTRVYDGTFCRGSMDPYTGSQILWSDTEIGETDEQPCPLDVNGSATRRCVNSSSVDPLVQAVWQLPDLSNCVSPFFKETLIAANSLSKQETVDPGSIIEITSGVTNATGSDTGNVLYAGDLSVAADTVQLMADLLLKSDPGRPDLHKITKGCGNVLSNIIDPSTAEVWKFTRKGYLENKITSILESVEFLSSNVASQFSKLLTSRRRRAVDDDVISENTTVLLNNLELSIHVLDRTENFSVYADDKKLPDTSDGIVLPEDVFINAIQGTSDPYIHLYYARFPSIAKLIESTKSEIKGPRGLFEPYINSEVLSSKFLNADESLFQSLKTPVKIRFTKKNSSQGILVPECVFLNTTATTNADRWSKKGCVRSDTESTTNTTVCYCSHLTNFAVLMDIYDVETSIDEFDAKILTYLSYGAGTLSILGCSISIIVFEYFRLKNQRVRIHEQLAVTIILVQLFFLVGIDRTENEYVCKVLAICLHYVLVAMFCWMLVEGAHLYLVLVKVFKSGSHMKKYVLIGWGVPVVIVGISAGIFHDDYGTGVVCWITHKVLLVAFLPPVSLVIVINTVVLVVVMKIMFNSMSKGSKSAIEERSSVKSGLKAACILLPLLGLTWIFGYLSITSKETLIFTYLFTFFNSMQGVFFFVFHCLLSVDVQNAYDRHSRRQSQIRLTESSFSNKRARKGSELDSSEYSGAFRDSVKTVNTSLNSTLDRRVSLYTGDHDGINRAYSVSFDDDVFVATDDHSKNKLHRRNSGNTQKQINTGNETPQRNMGNTGNLPQYDVTERQNGHVMNNIFRGSRQNSESSDGYVLYYGTSTPKQQNDIQTYSDYDKNNLYATVKK